MPAVVFRDGHDPRLFPHITLQPQLAIPLVKPARASMDYRSLDHPIFHPRLDHSPLPLRQTLHPAPLDRPHFRHRHRRPAMGSDPMEHIQHGLLASVGRSNPARRRSSRPGPLALARRFGRHSARRLRHDSSTNLTENSYRLHRRRRSGSRNSGRHGRSGVRSPVLR